MCARSSRRTSRSRPRMMRKRWRKSARSTRSTTPKCSGAGLNRSKSRRISSSFSADWLGRVPTKSRGVTPETGGERPMAVYTIIRIYEVPAETHQQATDRMLEALVLHVEKDFHVKDIIREKVEKGAKPGK